MESLDVTRAVTSDPVDVLPGAFIIGISGSISAGKTVMSLAVQGIFQDAMELLAPENVTINGNIIIFSTDDYLVASSKCPKRHFRVRKGDEVCVQAKAGTMVETEDHECLPAIDWEALYSDIQVFVEDDAIPATEPSDLSIIEEAEYNCHRRKIITTKQYSSMRNEVMYCIHGTYLSIETSVFLSFSLPFFLAHFTSVLKPTFLAAIGTH